MLLIIALATLLPNLALAYDVLILQSRRDPSYDEVLKGFRFAQKSSLRMLVLSDYAEVDVTRIVREDRPRLILAIGDAALKEARKVRTTPVLALMSLAVPAQTANLSNLTGISMFTAPERYMEIFRNMKARRVGVIYSSTRSGWYLNQARRDAAQAGIELVERQVTNARQTSEKLASLCGKVDALWMLPDTVAVTRDNVESYFTFGQKNSVPVVSFSGSYIALGAAAALEIDRRALGRQADGMAAQLLSDQDVEAPVIWPSKATLKRNSSVLQRLGLEATLSQSAD